jgi:biotin carboxylase
MELAARLGGGHDAELCEAALGVDLNGLAIDFALGTVPEWGLSPLSSADQPGDSPLRGQSSEEFPGGACVVFLVPPIGVLRSVEGVEQAEALPGVRWVRVYRSPGRRFGPLRRGADRAGAVLAVGDDRDDALVKARRAASAIRFVVDAHPA